MSLINVLFLGILPAGLLMWIGNMVRSRAEDDKAGNRWLLFLFSGLGVSVVILIITRSISEYIFNLSIACSVAHPVWIHRHLDLSLYP